MSKLSQVLSEMGLTCGQSCGCVSLFADSLDPIQSAIVLRIAADSGKISLELIQAAETEVAGRQQDNPQVFLDALASMSGGGDSGEMFSVPEPYDGNLTDEQMAVLAEVPEKDRNKVERQLRKIISSAADSKPENVFLQFEDGEVKFGGVRQLEQFVSPEVDREADPYDGELPVRLQQQLNKIVEEGRPHLERGLRKAIGMAYNNPDLVFMIVSSDRHSAQIGSISPEVDFRNAPEGYLESLPLEVREVMELLQQKRADAADELVKTIGGRPRSGTPWRSNRVDEG